MLQKRRAPREEWPREGEHEERVVRAVERQSDRPRLGGQPVRVIGEQCELRKRRAARHGRERDEADATLRELGEHPGRGAELVPDVRVVVLDGANRERRAGSPPVATL